MEKRLYMPGYYIDLHMPKENSDKQNLVINENGKKPELNKSTKIVQTENIIANIDTTKSLVKDDLIASIDKSVILLSFPTISLIKNRNTFKETKVPNNISVTDAALEECDTLILLTGEKLFVNIIENGQDLIKYKKCDFLNGPAIIINKSDISEIKYHNGKKEIITFNKPTSVPNENLKPKVEGLGVLSFLFSIAGLFIAGIALGIAAIIFGAISLARIARYPERLKWKIFGILAIFIGIADIVLVIIALSII
jgi:hypothetical protein